MTMRHRSILAVLAIAAPLALWPVCAGAQSMDLKATPAPRDRVAPSVPDRDLYPQRPSLPQRPNFIGPLSGDTRTGRAGIAGFTATNPPVGSRMAGDPDTAGWPGVGFAIEWGKPSRRVD